MFRLAPLHRICSILKTIKEVGIRIILVDFRLSPDHLLWIPVMSNATCFPAKVWEAARQTIPARNVSQTTIIILYTAIWIPDSIDFRIISVIFFWKILSEC